MGANSLVTDRFDRATRLAFIWCAVPMVILLFGGLTLAGFITPVDPSHTAAEVAQEYRSNNDRIKAGLALSFVSIIAFLLFGAALTGQLRRIESASPTLIYAQIACFASGSLIFVIPWVCWQSAAYRIDRSDTEIALLNDLGWMTFVFSYVAFTAWNIAIGLTIFQDTRQNPVYPRWVGYFTIFVGITFIPDNLIPFFKTGPFAWNGLFPYYMPFVFYGLWILVMFVMTVKAIHREAAEEITAGGGVPSDSAPEFELAPVTTSGVGG